MATLKSSALFAKAQNVIPGGVNSPVRAFKAVGGNPVFIQSAKGAFLTDVDGNHYIDLINSWGPMILGHAHSETIEAVREAVAYSFSFGAPTEKEVVMAELICALIPSIEKVRMVNSGTEATMSAIRLARGFTGKNKIIKFEGCYHGHGDSFLIAAGSGLVTMGAPDSAGVTQGVANDTLTVPFNNLDEVKKIAAANNGDIAAIILEPVVGNMGCVLPKNGFLEGLRLICDQEKMLLIFDEVMTGFRLSLGGAQERLNVKPDLTTLGKIIGGGMPVGAYGGRKEIMDFVSPLGPVYQAGTLSGNPIAMTAGLSMLKYLQSHPEVYIRLELVGKALKEGIIKELAEVGLPYTVNQIGSMYSLFFTNQQVVDFDTAKTSNLTSFAKYFQAMLKRGVYLAPSQYESLFISNAITDELVETILKANKESLKELK